MGSARSLEDKWLGENIPLKEKFPTLYQISNQQQQPISLLGSHKEEGWEWNFKWRRNLFDNEATMAAEFLEETVGLAVQQQGVDSWVWKQDSSGIYSTKTAYKFLLGEIRGESEDGSFSLLWKLKIPPKAKVFTWRLIKDHLPTKMNLRGRQVEIDDPLCPFCKNLDKDATHLFFNCSKVLSLWWETVSWVKSVGGFPKEPKDHFMHHSRSNAT
ncbi:putative ribonuclease H protein [Glycine max]|nr:putative ribonuclease H protein [Glycine max]